MEKDVNIKRHHSQTSYTRFLFFLIATKMDKFAAKLVRDFVEFDPNFFEQGTTEERQYPIFLAFRAEMYDTVRAIMEHPKVDVNAIKCTYTDDPFPFYVFTTTYKKSMYKTAKTREAIDFAIEVLKQIKDINQTDSCGCTMLHYACEDSMMYPIMEYICSREDAELEIQDYDGATPLDIALYAQNRQAAKFLKEKIEQKFAGVKKNA